MSRTSEVVGDAPIGRLSIWYAALFAPLFAGIQIALGVALDPLALALAQFPQWSPRVELAGIALPLVWFSIAAATCVQQLRRADRSRGRGRLLYAAFGGLLNALALAAGALVTQLAQLRIWLPGIGFNLPAHGALLYVVIGIAVAGALGGLACITGPLACWPLIPPERRRRIWVVVDALLLGAVTYAVYALPSQPPSAARDALALPIARHVITTAFVLRFLARMLPVVLDVIERVSFQPLVASRHLRSKKSGFLAAISVLSVLAVTVSSCALTTTLSVMGGFRQDLKRKILGNNAHIVIDREHASIEGWQPLLDQTRAEPGVIGASPFVHGEVMISSAANLGTAVLHGVDPNTVGDVSDLPANMRSGDLKYLSHPEKLLEAPPDRLRDVMMPDMPMPGASDDALREAAKPSGDGVPSTEELNDRIKALEALLKDNALKPAPPPPPPDTRDVLPGIVIGQELARSLRLYVGDEVNVVAPLGALGPQGLMPKARPFRVAGVFYSGMYEYDMKYAYVTLETAQRFLGTGEAISGLEVKVDQVERAPLIADRLRKALKRDGLRVKDWQDLNSRLFGALALEKLAMFIALGIAILVASFCIAGTLTLMVQEKGREVAILKAMGTGDRTIVGVFVIEGGMIGVLGAALGLFLGYMMCFAAEHFGIEMNPEVYYIDRLPVHMDAAEFALTGLAAVLICLVITVYPALLASRLRPVEALRYE